MATSKNTVVHRNLIIALAARHRLPAVYAFAFFEAGGLMYYGTDFVDLCRQAAFYVDRILRGANPAELPVQTPTVRNCCEPQTAKALGLIVPPGLLVAADEVMEKGEHASIYLLQLFTAASGTKRRITVLSTLGRALPGLGNSSSQVGAITGAR